MLYEGRSTILIVHFIQSIRIAMFIHTLTRSLNPANKNRITDRVTNDPFAFFSVIGLILLVVVLIFLLTITARRSAQDEWNRSLLRRTNILPRRTYTQQYIDSLEDEPTPTASKVTQLLGQRKKRETCANSRRVASSNMPRTGTRAHALRPYRARDQDQGAETTPIETKPLIRQPTLTFKTFRVR